MEDTLIFVKVVEGGSFTAAARDLRLPKTTVSRKVRELELRLGVQLLHRTTRRLGLTEAGGVYFEHCRKIPQALADAETAVGQLQGQPRGTLRVTSSYSVMVSLIAPLLGEFRVLYPDLFVDLVLTHRTLDLVEDEIDIALRMGTLPDSSMAARQLAVLPNRVYASAAYLARHGEPKHPLELRQHSALVTRVARRGSGYAWPMSNGGAAESFEITPVIEADDPQVLKAPLFAGAGLMMATDLIMREHVAEGLVVPVLLGWVGRCPALNAVFPRGHAQPPKLRVFIDFLVARLQREAAAPPIALPLGMAPDAGSPDDDTC
ncbi:LysR family transcriptional regulator [Variovorax sp. 770b2]|uniref:LysR family transcriptional regulator n=1 Tax=Variovorax sp. 770b2 TaxID=1566271 RepID=UPI0008E15E44|nr:LysR family transcriptional regulator [Variovorax sp. 770b2]SFP48750.1 DNA-binding transcriptional regulator, LysR family [Variovorax sp. 770b2]